MTVGIVGLGLMGGSFAKAYAEAGHIVYGTDRDRSVLDFAKMSGVLAGELTDQTLADCDLVLIALWVISAQVDPAGWAMVACFGMFFLNDMYGFVNWRRMEKRQAE